jgi:hypothetical protein
MPLEKRIVNGILKCTREIRSGSSPEIGTVTTFSAKKRTRKRYAKRSATSKSQKSNSIHGSCKSFSEHPWKPHLLRVLLKSIAVTAQKTLEQGILPCKVHYTASVRGSCLSVSTPSKTSVKTSVGLDCSESLKLVELGALSWTTNGTLLTRNCE